MNQKLLAAIIVIAIAALIVGGVVAAVAWTQNGSWTLAASSFTVTSDPVGTTINLGIVQSTDTKTITYTLFNNGNVPLTINTNAVATGATPTLNATSVSLNPNTYGYVSLTLSQFTSTGSYTTTFTPT